MYLYLCEDRVVDNMSGDILADSPFFKMAFCAVVSSN